ncbi:MAG: rod shape-determining protein MreC [Pseudomonadota bacterium]
MASRFKQDSEGLHFTIACLVCVALIVVDGWTRWLVLPRNLVSIALRPVQELAAMPSRLEGAVTSVLQSEPDVKIAYDILRKEYFQLKSEALLLRALEQENNDLRALLDASPRLQERLTLAELVNARIDRDNHQLIVSRGSRHEVYNGQAVIDDLGVVGQVTEVMPLTSNVTLITDPGHALPVQVQRNGLRATVHGTGSVNQLRIPFLNPNSDIEVGDLLISSGLGGRFPVGYPVAEVDAVVVIEDEAFIRVDAKPVARLDRSNSVLLLSRTP